MKRLEVDKNQQCVGCRQCELVCSLSHEAAFGPWLGRVRIEKNEATAESLPFICRQCVNAKCASSCPRGAIQKDERGILRILPDLCDGCMICIEACPFDAMIFDRDAAKALKCDECGGAFCCVSVCPAKVLVVEER